MTRRIVIPQLTDQDLIALALLWYRDAWGQLQDANPLPWLWVVAPEPYWAWEGKAGGPLLLELGRVLERESTGRNCLREATVPVLLDSGAFSMIRDHGRWIRSAKEHVAAARRICAALGTVQYVATQDWMCEPIAGPGAAGVGGWRTSSGSRWGSTSRRAGRPWSRR